MSLYRDALCFGLRKSCLRCPPLLCPEPIHSIVVPDEDYLEKVQALCKKHNVLLICDEIQTVRLAALSRTRVLRLTVIVHTGSRAHGQATLLPAQPERQARHGPPRQGPFWRRVPRFVRPVETGRPPHDQAGRARFDLRWCKSRPFFAQDIRQRGPDSLKLCTDDLSAPST